VDEFDELPDRAEKKARKRRGVPERLEARALVARTTWLFRPLVTGPKGIHAVSPTSPSERLLVDADLIGRTNWALLRAEEKKSRIDVLVKSEGGYAAWRARIEARLQVVTAAMKALEREPHDPEALAIEEACRWLGEDRARPSRAVSNARLAAHVTSERAPGRSASAVLLGQRRASCPIPPELESFAACGRALRTWALDDLFEVARAIGIRPLVALARKYPAIDARAAGAASVDLARNRPDASLAGFLEGLAEIVGAIRDEEPEFARRRGRIVHLVHRAFDALPDAASAPDQADPFSSQILTELKHEAPFLAHAHKPGDPFAMIDAACQWFLGFPLPDRIIRDVFQPHPWRRPNTVEEIRTKVTDAIAHIERSVPRIEDTIDRFVRIAAEVAKTGDPAETSQKLADWIRTCVEVCSSGSTRREPLELAAKSIEAVLGNAHPSQWSKDQFIRLLGEFGDRLLARALAQTVARDIANATTADALTDALTGKKAAAPIHLLGYLGHLSRAQLEMMITCDLLSAYPIMIQDQPRRAGLLVDLIARNRSRIDLLADAPYTLSRLFKADDDGLVALIIEWFDGAVEIERIAWRSAAKFIDAILPYRHEDDAKAEPRYEPFLAKQFSLVRWLAKTAFGDTPAERATFRDDQWFTAELKVLEIAWLWARAGHADVDACARHVLGFLRRTDHSSITDPELRLVVAFAAGDPRRIPPLLDRKPLPVEQAAAAQKGWDVLEHHPALRAFLTRAAAKKEHVPTIHRLLAALALTVRLPGRDRLMKKLRALKDAAREAPDTPSAIDALRAMRKLGGHDDLPQAVREILGRPERLEKELEGLRRQPRDEKRAARIQKLEAELADRPGLDAWIHRDLSKALERHLDAAGLEAFEALIQEAVGGHWRAVVAGVVPEAADHPDWMNALHLMLTIRSNRRLLKQLLRAEARGTPNSFRAHPSNVRFLEAMEEKGIDTTAWCRSRTLALEVRGERIEAYTEDQPLRIFQMGNIFGTCLSAGAVNAFSCVANAVEINKRVLYVRDAKDRILARKLIVLFPNGQLAGYRSYGAGLDWDHPDVDRPWLKIILDLLCLEIAVESNARLVGEEEPQGTAELFAKWYDDGTEPFDPWIVRGGASPPSRLFVLEQLKSRLETDLGGQRDAAEWLRALLWLREDAVALVEDGAVQARIGPHGVDFLRRHGDSAALSRLLTQPVVHRA
jgi:hypothetical protein